MSLSVKGNIIKVLNLESGVSKAGNEWKKQEFVIEMQEQQFTRKVCFTLFNVESREYNGKWFHNINAWKIDVAQKNSAPEGLPEYRYEDIPPEPMENMNDLPF